MARKKKSRSSSERTRLSFSQIVFIAFGVIIILSMVITLIAPF